MQNNDNVQFIINSSDLSQIITNQTQPVLNINLPQIETKSVHNLTFKTINKPNVNKKIKMSSEEIEQSVAKKVKTIMESIAVNNDVKKSEVIAKNGNSEVVNEVKKNEPIKCELCGNMYKDQASLRKHKYIVHEAQASFKCDFCGKAFKTSYR